MFGLKMQGNLHKLTENHLFCFHMSGKFDIRQAKKTQDEYEMESVPIETEEYIVRKALKNLRKPQTEKYDSGVVNGKQTVQWKDI